MDPNRMDFRYDDLEYDPVIEDFMLKMACKLPPMVYCAPREEEVLELDFGECKQPSTRHKTRLKSEENRTYSEWHCLPDILLEDIFQRLSIRERFYASQVCRNWNRIFYSRRVWNTFVLHDRTLTRRKFNYYMGDQYVLDHHRTQLCLHRIARGIRKVIIKPMENFFNLYEFMTILSYFCENYEQLHLIRTLDFTFGADWAVENRDNVSKVFGTGGKLLQALKRLMDDLIGLKNLSLQNLLLEKEEAEYLLDDVAYNCCESLRTLRVVNCSKEPFAMLHPVVFVNLQTLTLSPQHLNEEIVEMIGNTKVRDLYLVQTKLTPPVDSVSYKSWRECRKRSPRLNVHHVMEDGAKTKVVWQDGAPVRSVIYDTPDSEVSVSSIFTASNMYCHTLEVLAYKGLPQYSLQDSFEERADTSLMLLSKTCLYLDTIVFRDQISTATLILIAQQSHNLRRLIVRNYALIKKCEWTHNPEWTDSYYNWLRITSTSYEKTVQEISKILGFKWKPLTDDEFNRFIL